MSELHFISNKMTSNVGGAGVYEASDQRTAPASEVNKTDRYNEGKAHSHNQQDSKDERSIANKLARHTAGKDDVETQKEEVTQSKKDSTLPAVSHGNEPSKGAKIDQELKEEEEEMMKKKGSFGSKK
ncbi:MAG: hypothetical protein M1828_004615 [Chrysothrix sp. TS-e1954]|nr:MAG: hypothetical protein M1828_004615 [Chrysothrix sp. TS-e1954]